MYQNIEIQLFGPIISYISLFECSHVKLEQYEFFQKMGYRNRFEILSAGGPQMITVPLVGGRDQKGTKTWELRINYEGRWMVESWRSLQSSYNRSPFFYHYGPQLKAIFDSRPEFLWQLCLAGMEWVITQIGWKGNLDRTLKWSSEVDVEAVDLRNRFVPKNREEFVTPAYQQVFGDRFINNLSILDLLFNVGPSSGDYLKRASAVKLK